MKKALVLAMALVASVSFGALYTLTDGAGNEISSDMDAMEGTFTLVATYGSGGMPLDGFGYAYTISEDAKNVAAQVTEASYSIAPTVTVTGNTVDGLASGAASTAITEASELFRISFDAVAGSTIAISNPGYHGDGTRPAEWSNINVVPEPMTMALLGLGGMLIRRKK
ncbi:hypothetical protein SMSP2_02837 [Limihaloglobus sulfuriphilus]|uniref:PEP-CTERM protein-sorting domain-containing protein n=1 Tax=Limihaloglobus sulfuriphilus TaxID=1851148 RepID=A0A1Q2MJ98_9BACT|nr:PEP-CTERM sorting domain-containing protein [Limihaloglobus sulfuriphilus]AQQ72452.1 hypothetical protein SMSP2_02837 [Limihaloglobus sulfuriphilus]